LISNTLKTILCELTNNVFQGFESFQFCRLNSTGKSKKNNKHYNNDVSLQYFDIIFAHFQILTFNKTRHNEQYRKIGMD
jgi:hypothetical protein